MEREKERERDYRICIVLCGERESVRERERERAGMKEKVAELQQFYMETNTQGQNINKTNSAIYKQTHKHFGEIQKWSRLTDNISEKFSSTCINSQSIHHYPQLISSNENICITSLVPTTTPKQPNLHLC